MVEPASESDAESGLVNMAEDHLLALPNELFDAVLTYLDLGSMKKLRLASTHYAEKCLCPAFKRCYSYQQTDLTPASLQRLFQLTTHPVLGPVVANLTVVAVFHDPADCVATIHSLRRCSVLPQSCAQKLLENTELLSWLMSRRQEQQGQFIDDVIASLAHVLENLGSLRSLTLATRIIRDRSQSDQSANPGNINWNSLWADCHRLFKIVTLAMTSSKVKVDTLSIFDKAFGKVQSRAFTVRSADLAARGFSAAAGASIKNLHLSFSTATFVPDSDIYFTQEGYVDSRLARCFSIDNAEARGPENFPGIAEFLKQTPNLEGLDLHMYTTLKGAPWAYDRVFTYIAEEVRLPKLRRLTLRNIRSPYDEFLLFLRSYPDITDLDLREIRISGGSWLPIFRHFQSMHKLSKLHLENLWNGPKHLLNLAPTNPVFDDGRRGPGHSFPTKAGVMVHTRDITVEELRQEGGLRFATLPGRPRGRGSKVLMGWMKERRLAYGPPL